MKKTFVLPTLFFIKDETIGNDTNKLLLGKTFP